MKSKPIVRYMLLPVICVSFFASSCESPTQSGSSLTAPTLTTPVVTGIWVTNSSGPAIVGRWGNPSDVYGAGGGFSANVSAQNANEAGNIPRVFDFYLPFPNPFAGSTALSIALPAASVVSIWVVEARSVGDKGSDLATVGGSTLISPVRTTVKVLADHRDLTAGIHRFIWDGTDDNGKPVPSGFYRAYAEVNGGVSWHDMFVYRKISDMPPGMRKLVYQ